MENNITTHVYKINARSLLSFKPDELWDNLYGKIELTFDDGKVINTNSEEVIFSRYFWETHIKYPKLPLLYTHFITKHYDKGMLNSKSHTSLLSTLSHDLLYLVFRDNAVPSVIEKSLELFYDIINNLYNGLVLNTAEYGTSIDIVDFIEVMHNKKITDSIDEVKKDYGPDNVANVFKVTKDVILNDESLDNNMLIKSARNGTISLNQLLQCVGIRGYVTELDSKQFEFPMARGFAKGFSNIYNIAVESRSGAKALFFSDSALQDSEYFARRLQLLTMPVERIVYTDCCSTDYLLWTVKGSVVEDGKQVMMVIYHC